MPTANAAFLERSCTQAELMSRQSKRTAAKAENTRTNISENENAGLSEGLLPSEVLQWQRIMKCLPRGRDGCHTCYMDGRLREERLTPARHTGGLR